MKKMKKNRRLCAVLCLLLLLSGCGGLKETEQESLDIDYVSADGKVTEETVSPEKETVIDRLMGKLSSDKEEAGRQTDVSEDTGTDGEESGIQAAYSEGSSSRADAEADAEKAGRSEEKENGASKGDAPDGASKGDIPDGAGKADGTKEQATVTMTIRCDTAVANGMHEESKWAGIVPANGCILPVTVLELEEGDTVFTLLCRVRDQYKLQMEYSGGGGSEYIEGINNLYEFDGGRWSGWMYCVNGWYPNYGCGQYVVSDHDVIEWNYTCDLGLDLDGAWWEGAEEWKKTHE